MSNMIHKKRAVKKKSSVMNGTVRKITIRIAYPTALCGEIAKNGSGDRPKISILKPLLGTSQEVTNTGFDFILPIQAGQHSFDLELEYLVNYKAVSVDLVIVICSSCGNLLNQMLTQTPGIFRNGKIVPGIPQCICPLCGYVFVHHHVLRQLHEQKDNLIIQPGR